MLRQFPAKMKIDRSRSKHRPRILNAHVERGENVIRILDLTKPQIPITGFEALKNWHSKDIVPIVNNPVIAEFRWANNDRIEDTVKSFAKKNGFTDFNITGLEVQ